MGNNRSLGHRSRVVAGGPAAYSRDLAHARVRAPTLGGMEPFDILSTPARIRWWGLAAIGVVTGLLAYLAVAIVQLAVGIVSTDGPRLLPGVVLALGLALFALAVRMLRPQWALVHRYFRHDRGKQVVTFRLESAGWRWLQAGTDVLVPWETLAIRVEERRPDRLVIRMEHPAPVLCAHDPLSRLLFRNLTRTKATDIPFTLSSPTEEELAEAITLQSGGRVTLIR